ncbi:PEP-CTERM sorting domain-containing protein [Paucibacter sp. O1-1]|nr:PEP-CTERM sorting domain-containing protein [Paucibacter sp. O1-1]MDA3829206.1 PEP-CTERM sorting domain-containing protein [Paucibacter sp. O1-1]
MKTISRISNALLVLAGTTLAAAGAHSSSLAIKAVVPSVGHSFRTVEGGGYDNIIGEYYGGPPVPSFSANLANYDSISFSIAAPAGMQFSYTPLAQIDKATLQVGLFFSFGGYTTWDVLPTTVSMRGADGALTPAFSSIETRAYDGGASFYMEGWLPFGNQPLSFTELVIEADLSGMKARADSLSNFVPSFGSAVGLLTYSRGGIDDPGPSLSLTRVSAVPEPATALLALIGLAVLALRSRATGPG